MDAIALYRSSFKPSAQLDRPYVMLGFNVFAADTDEEAWFRASAMQQAFVNLRSGRPAQLPAPVEGFYQGLQGPLRAMLDEVLGCSAIGKPETVHARIQAFVERTGADELMIACQMFDHTHRLRSYEITAQAAGAL